MENSLSLYKIFCPIWRNFLIANKGCQIDLSQVDLNFDSFNYFDRNLRGKKLLIINGDRNHFINLVRKVSDNYDQITDGIQRNTFEIIDFRRYFAESIFSPALIWLLKLCLCKIHVIIFRYFKCLNATDVLMSIVADHLIDNNVTDIHMFTSNSRIAEFVRIISILHGVNCTEFLHGISSDAFGDYYTILESLAYASGAKLKYVNMLPKLPQPPSVEQNLVYVNGVQLYYKNEDKWIESNNPIYDVIIVGGAVSYENYLTSKYHLNELKLINYCLANGFSIAYCPHPKIANYITKNLPAGVVITTIAKSILASRVIVGHYSTVLFSAHLMDLKVLVFNDAINVLPKNILDMFSNVDEYIYSDQILSSILSSPVKIFELYRL